jgi:transcriptional regulator with XRE-family HTH domain
MAGSKQRQTQARMLGTYIKAQRELANLSLRAVADKAGISNPYLSQLERGLHEPSVRVLSSIAKALRIPADELLEHAGLVEPDDGTPNTVDTEAAISRDPHLTTEQRQALLSVYRSYRAANDRSG